MERKFFQRNLSNVRCFFFFSEIIFNERLFIFRGNDICISTSYFPYRQNSHSYLSSINFLIDCYYQSDDYEAGASNSMFHHTWQITTVNRDFVIHQASAIAYSCLYSRKILLNVIPRRISTVVRNIIDGIEKFLNKFSTGQVPVLLN